VSRFLPTRKLTKQHHNPASHHECKNTRHRDSAPTAHTAERYQQASKQQNRKSLEKRRKAITQNSTFANHTANPTY
jgi:hypothetical protein